MALFNALCGCLEWLWPHEKRLRAYIMTRAFTKTYPRLTSFLLVQLLFSLLPLLIFVSFIGTLSMTVAGVALVFTLFWIGVAMIVLLPFLVISISCASFFWVGGFTAFSIASWLSTGYFQGGSATQADKSNKAARQLRKKTDHRFNKPVHFSVPSYSGKADSGKADSGKADSGKADSGNSQVDIEVTPEETSSQQEADAVDGYWDPLEMDKSQDEDVGTRTLPTPASRVAVEHENGTQENGLVVD